jgi:hypothetical protein
MVPLEYGVNKIPRVMGNVSGLFQFQPCVIEPLNMDQSFFMKMLPLCIIMTRVFVRLTDDGMHVFHHRSFRTKKIREGNDDKQGKSYNKPCDQDEDLSYAQKLPVQVKLNSPVAIEQQEEDRDHRVINEVFQKRLGSGSEEFEMVAVKNERGDMPAHDENAHGNADKSSTKGIDVSEVFRCKEQGIRPERTHKITVDGAAEDIPEQ